MGMRGGEWGEGSCWKAGSKGVAEVREKQEATRSGVKKNATVFEAAAAVKMIACRERFDRELVLCSSREIYEKNLRIIYV
jgi:hypothetical protein